MIALLAKAASVLLALWVYGLVIVVLGALAWGCDVE